MPPRQASSAARQPTAPVSEPPAPTEAMKGISRDLSAIPVPTDPAAFIQELNDKVVRFCKKCRLTDGRTNTVFGEGDIKARLMFIGEGPGETEDETGRPFVGRAGQKLNEMINAMGLTREQVYIANIVKCRPPGNRAPMADEVAACTPYLLQQIKAINPDVIVTLGLPATQFLLDTDRPMKSLRGIWHDFQGIKVMPTYHPAYLLRNYTTETRAAVWSDLQKVMQELGLNQG